MRKLLWCCAAAAGAAVCAAFWTAGYVSQNPDSAIGRCALAVCPAVRPPCAAGQPGAPGAGVADDLVPDDPVPVDDPPPLPTPGSHVPPEVMALGTPPIIIQDEEDLNASANPAPTETAPAKHVDVEGARPITTDVAGAEVRPTSVPPVMPRCMDDDDAAPRMPYCTDDPEDGQKVSTAGYREFDACAFWMGFFTAPSRIFAGDAGRCEEDANYQKQYSGVPYTGQECAEGVQQTTAHQKPLPSLPEVEESVAPPVPTDKKQQADPSQLFDRPHRLQLSRPSEPRSDTMEMRPTDWKPYSLDPGPF